LDKKEKEDLRDLILIALVVVVLLVIGRKYYPNIMPLANTIMYIVATILCIWVNRKRFFVEGERNVFREVVFACILAPLYLGACMYGYVKEYLKQRRNHRYERESK